MFRGLRRAANRDCKHYRRTKGMRVDGRSVFLIKKKLQEKAEDVHLEKQREFKENFDLDSEPI